MKYFFLLIAIGGEAIGTTFLKESDGFTRPVPTAIMVVCYVVTFYFLSLALRSMPTGVAYAIWSGVGVVLVTTIAWIFQGQRLDAAAIAGITLIVAGSVVLNLFSKSTAH
ncbi:DMT family transporter [Glacieibacterium sp.]|uniref:DMT family transporter n=1 Tax=Glacieibacterium sp. TaxID=2860237 RepID=UPI003AFFBFE9